MDYKGYFYQKAFLWYVLSLVISASNDAITKYVGACGVAPGQITFYRVVSGSIVLIIYKLLHNPTTFRTAHLRVHAMRGGIFFIASLLWSYGLTKASVASATTIGFTIPLFVVAFAHMLLKEKVSWQLWLATFTGFFAAMIIVFDPLSLIVEASSWQVNIYLIAFVVSALLFALLDIINKKYIAKEPMFTMLLYSNLIASWCALPFMNFQFALLDLCQQSLLFLLGLGGVAILFCLLKAYTYAPLALLAPLRYIEVLIACIIDYVCFNHLPTLNYLIGASLIIPASLFVVSRKNCA